jgi:tRNA-specific 2-thiouridylase
MPGFCLPGGRKWKREAMSKAKVVVGMSGGVDSSVAAWLLKEQGYDVIGVTMQIWQDEDTKTQEENGGCCGLSAVDDARRVAWDLGIPYYVMNFKEEFKSSVIDYFVEEYQKGRTPNPCIACNRYVKWESLLKRSLDIGADFIATGHYAQIDKLPNGRYALKKSVTAAKDQTYALYNLTQEQLARTLMPVGAYTKDRIREIAGEISLRVAHKPDSQEICFIPDNNYAGFIEENAGEKAPEGNFVDLNGQVIGRHKGITHYTVGQRKGLNLSMGHPVFVVEIRPETNEVVIGDGEDVFSDSLRAGHLNWMAIDGLHGKPMQVTAKIRYSHKGALCTIQEVEDGVVECKFDEPQRAITPGQAVVFYDGDFVVGGGTIL